MDEQTKLAMVDPALAVATISLIETLIIHGPQAVKTILDAWGHVDPTAEDFDALALLARQRLTEKEGKS